MSRNARARKWKLRQRMHEAIRDIRLTIAGAPQFIHRPLIDAKPSWPREIWVTLTIDREIAGQGVVAPQAIDTLIGAPFIDLQGDIS